MDRLANLVSVIIPCYNHGTFVLGAIENVFEQTYKNVEIIIVDDGSTDKYTRQALNKISNPSINVFFKENGGVASARNYGIKRSKGQYILTLDADDRFKPEFIEKAIQVLENNSSVGMVTSYMIRDYVKVSSKVKLKGGDLSTFVKKHESSASLLYRYQCWEEADGYDEEIKGYEDWDFAVGVTKKGWTVHSIPEYLFYYRNMGESLYDIHKQSGPENVRHMVEKHNDAFQKYIVEVLYDKERTLKELRDTKNRYQNSSAQKIGSLALTPFKFIKSVFNFN